MAAHRNKRNQARDSDADRGFAGSELESPDAKRTRHAHPGFNVGQNSRTRALSSIINSFFNVTTQAPLGLLIFSPSVPRIKACAGLGPAFESLFVWKSCRGPGTGLTGKRRPCGPSGHSRVSTCHSEQRLRRLEWGSGHSVE